ncbi:bifunctional cytidylyltransferase/SDR family oxidoreductase [Spongiactinospora gelatinilytica]|uniref:bifunctional cytidylyltransferase/SDR family oxidoreductase n=1 Tax=Spongiactinospora gelatinilytica TaxID=2666298 RepID=UPI001F330047|nr:bifunctional cytidylyltransferase/SDR family oxidoreductase [Spongiactinospora gelatinilytica]
MTASDDRRRRTVAAILAGGVGARAGLKTPKQFARVAGRSILAHTLAVFEGAPQIDEIVVLMTPGYVREAEEIVALEGFRKVRAVVEGGASRTETTWRALEHIGDGDADVLLHDAVRFLLEPAIITRCVAALAHHRAVGVAVPSSDTLLRVDPAGDGEVIRDIPDRALFRRAQTPQGFRLEVIREAYLRALADPGFASRPATDDCGVVLRYLPEVPIHIVPGSERNIKVTHPTDLAIAETLFHLATTAIPRSAADLSGRAVTVLGDGPVAGALAALAARRGAKVATALDGPADCVVIVTPGAPGALGEAAEGDVSRAVEHGVLGPVRAARAALPYLRESRGHLLFCAGGGGGSLAAVTESAPAGLARALAGEEAASGVRVNCVTARTDDPGRIAEACLAVLASTTTGQVTEAR